MSVRDALIREVLKQPEPLLREVQRYLALLVEQQRRGIDGGSAAPAEAWPAGYFQKTAGAFTGESLERPPQLPFEKREDW